MNTPPARHLRLVRPPSPTATGDPDDPAIAALIDQATAWTRVVMPIEDDRDVPVCRHLVVVRNAPAAGVLDPTTTP